MNLQMERHLTKIEKIKYEFVEFIPDELKEGILYISISFATVVHNCACGCGERIVTPIKPTDWALTWDGDTVTLYPSIGNWSIPCKSHYWIKENEIVWSRGWSDFEIELGRKQDKKAKDRYYKKFSKKINKD